jgi:hypothetical protein
VGEYSDGAAFHGFVRFAGGKIHAFDVPRSIGTDANSVNNSGVIAGEYMPNKYHFRGFVRSP